MLSVNIRSQLQPREDVTVIHTYLEAQVVRLVLGLLVGRELLAFPSNLFVPIHL